MTTSKKDNLILNVDGCIAVCFVDLMRNCGAFSPEEAEDYLKMGVLNGLFVLGRSIGLIAHFLDQKRLRTGLYRHPWGKFIHLAHLTSKTDVSTQTTSLTSCPASEVDNQETKAVWKSAFKRSTFWEFRFYIPGSWAEVVLGKSLVSSRLGWSCAVATLIDAYNACCSNIVLEKHCSLLDIVMNWTHVPTTPRLHAPDGLLSG